MISTLPQSVRWDFSNVGYDEAMRRAQRASQHFPFQFDIAGSAFCLSALGGKYVNPSM